MIRGGYRGMSYTIEQISHPVLGSHYDVKLLIGMKLSYEREFSLNRVLQLICQRIDTLALEEEVILFPMYVTDTLIKRWNLGNKLIKHEQAMTAAKTSSLFSEMILISTELKRAGYSLAEDGHWNHLSTVN